jgi:hypothetical protein
LQLARHVSFLLSNLLRGPSFIKYEFAKIFFQATLTIFMSFDDVEVHKECVWAISFYLESKEMYEERIWDFLSCGEVVSKFIDILDQPDVHTKRPVLR